MDIDIENKHFIRPEENIYASPIDYMSKCTPLNL